MAQAPRPRPQPRPIATGANLRYAKTVVLDDPVVPAPPDDTGERVRQVSDAAMPWLISGLVHLGIILLVLALGVGFAIQKERDTELIIPTTHWDNSRPELRLTSTPLLPSAKTIERAKAAPAPSRQPDTTAADPLKQLGISGLTTIPVPGSTTKHPDGTGDRGWFDDGNDDESHRPPAPGGGGRSVVYVIDASGSMAEHFVRIQRELVESLNDLKPTDRFTVLFFQDRSVIELKPAGLRPATKANLTRACDWAGVGSANVSPHGASDPLPALRRALSMRPGEVWVLSDNITGKGRFALEADRLLSSVDALRRQYRTEATRLNTVQFLYPDRHGVLAELSKRTGGVHRFVREADL